MKKLLVVVLALCIASFAVAENINKADAVDAINAYQAGVELTKAQDAILSQIGYGSGNSIDNTGGPDDFGYIYKDSEEADGPVFGWIDITATGTSVILDMSDDNYGGPYPMGFSFPFYGTDRTDFYVQSNGSISFYDGYISLSNYEMPYASYGAMIAWFWDDLDPADATDADLLYETMMVNDQNALVLSFLNWDEYAGNPDPTLQESVTAQIILFEDGTITIQYQTVETGIDISSCTIGMQNDDASTGLTVLYNGSIADYPYDSLAIEFSSDVVADASLTGTVTDFDTGNPIVGAEVTAGGVTVTTDGSGVYNITDLFPVTVNVTATATDYFNFGPESVDLVSGVNTFDFQMVMAPTQTFFTDFETDGEPFSADSVWAYGMPVVDPTGAYSGDYAWGTVLDGDYDNSQDVVLMSTPITVESPAAFMTYYHWFEYETGWDGYNVNISIDGGTTWTVLVPEGDYPDDSVSGLGGEAGFTGTNGAWEMVTVPFAGYEGQEVVFGFRHGTDSSVNGYSGVTIDDFALYGTGGGVEPDPVTLTLTPTNTVIPPSGGDVVYDAQLVSTIPAQMAGLRYQTFVTLPNSNVVGPLANIPFNLTPFMDITVTGQTQSIPSNAPTGTYTFTGIAGVPNNPNLQVSDSFTFEKTGVAADGVDNWDASEFVIASDENVTATLPTAYAMNKAYPNPFNPSTSIMIALPETSDLTVSVFNVMGQQVAQLANGKFSAGQHNFSFEASNLASGLYFIQAQVPGQLNAIQKVTLMK
ncbi:carboxypeptidase regulatory-like domain-containing protein [bacterium]|nr:carboxypeptidase regulatory-like domain-containing protein [bacterium]